VDPFQNELWDAKRSMPTLPSSGFLVAYYKHSGFRLENPSHGVIAQAPQRSDFGDGVVADGEARCFALILVAPR
jgi:hypothetical protein